MSYTWAEPFAGAAAVALRLVGGRHLTPPVAWMGGKRRYARAIADAMGVPEGRPDRVLLADAGPWGWVWPLLLSAESAHKVADVLRSWVGEHPRDLWKRLADQPPAEEPHERAAQWLWLQARSASGVPIWWDGWRHVDGRGRGASDRGEDLRWPGHESQRERWVSTRPQQGGGVRDAKHVEDTRIRGEWKASNGSGQAVKAGHKTLGSWEQGRGEGRSAQPAGQRGTWRFDARPGDAQDSRLAGGSGETNGRTGGMVNPATIADRIEAIAAAFGRVDARAYHGNAREVGACEGFAYLDPPYVGATGYGWGCPRSRVSLLAQAWKRAGAVVAVSEAEPLEIEGWHHLELTRPGGKPEWLTLSIPPVRVPEQQLELY